MAMIAWITAPAGLSMLTSFLTAALTTSVWIIWVTWPISWSFSSVSSALICSQAAAGPWVTSVTRTPAVFSSADEHRLGDDLDAAWRGCSARSARAPTARA